MIFRLQNDSTATTSTASSDDAKLANQRKLDFLLKQTEIFTHFIKNATKPLKNKDKASSSTASGSKKNKENAE